MRSLNGGQFVDLFGVVMLTRLVGVLFHFPPLTMSEAGLWSVTISAFAMTNTFGGPKQS
jgi:hypothetical protein